ncbi:unnamed protein product [Lota lota]
MEVANATGSPGCRGRRSDRFAPLAQGLLPGFMGQGLLRTQAWLLTNGASWEILKVESERRNSWLVHLTTSIVEPYCGPVVTVAPASVLHGSIADQGPENSVVPSGSVLPRGRARRPLQLEALVGGTAVSQRPRLLGLGLTCGLV